MGVLRALLFAVAGAAALLLLAAQAGALRGRMPDDLGLRDGRLKRPSSTPNSVSSQADLWPDHPQRDDARIAAFAPVKGDGAATLAALRTLLQRWPGATVVTDRPDYLYVQFQTRVLKFVDDAEFWLDPQTQLVHVRSASRIGRKDFGVNRERVEAIRAALTAR